GSVKNLRIFKRKLAPFYQYYKQLPHHFDPSDSEYYLTAPEIHPEYLSALESLISNKYGKRNAAKLKKRNDTDKQAEEQQALLIRLHADTIKLSIDQTWAAYMRRATQMMDLYQQTNGEKGWDDRCIITAQTVKNFLNAPEIRQIWYSKRHGKKPASNVFSVVTKRKSASFANAKWVIDGKPMQINFSHKGYNYSRIHAFVVIDEHSWAVVGYHLSFSENTDQVIMALRDACMRTKCLPHEIQADNSSAIVSWHAKHAIRSISKHFTLAQAGNARSKRIENFFGHFNAQILKFKPGFYGKHHNKLDHAVNEEEMARQIKGNLLP
ncbi:MAG: transposase family protein, partial [Pseudomonadales bacterium]